MMYSKSLTLVVADISFVSIVCKIFKSSLNVLCLLSMTIVDEKSSSRASSRLVVFVIIGDGLVGETSLDVVLLVGYFCGDVPRGVLEPDFGDDLWGEESLGVE